MACTPQILSDRVGWPRVEGSVYAKHMEMFSRVFYVLGELASLLRALLTAGVLFIALCARSRTALGAENFFHTANLRWGSLEAIDVPAGGWRWLGKVRHSEVFRRY